MFVMTATTGVSRRNVRSYSSASTTITSPSPETALDPNDATLPPTMMVGSSPACEVTRPTIVVVVVLPCVPAMPTPRRIRISSPSISARLMRGISRRPASTVSGFWCARTADEYTTTSTSWTCSAAWPS